MSQVDFVNAKEGTHNRGGNKYDYVIPPVSSRS